MNSAARNTLSVNGQFRKPGADENPHTGQRITKNLARRQADWKRMSEAKDVGDGHRDITGYRRPGSNKK